MPVSIKLKYPQDLIYKPIVRQRLYDIANFVRDLWLARSPQRTGEYIKGLLKQGSIRIGSGEIVITNFAPHAQYYEDGHKAFNIAEKMLANGKNVKVSKEGFKYKFVKISRKMDTRFRSERLQKSVMKAFGAIVSGKVRNAVYKTNRTAKKPLKIKFRPNSKSDVFVISEKTLKQRPGSWVVPAMPPRHLAKSIQQEVMPILNEAIKTALEQQKKKELPKRDIPKFKGTSFSTIQKRGRA